MVGVRLWVDGGGVAGLGRNSAVGGELPERTGIAGVGPPPDTRAVPHGQTCVEAATARWAGWFKT